MVELGKVPGAVPVCGERVEAAGALRLDAGVPGQRQPCWQQPDWVFDKFRYCGLPAQGKGNRAGRIGGLLLGAHAQGHLRYIGDVGLLTGLSGDTPVF